MTTSFACERFASVAEFFAWGGCDCAITVEDDTALIEAALDNASDILMLTSDGHVHGRCTETVRPMTESGCWPRRSPTGYHTTMAAVEWGTTIPLRGPNTEILQVVVDGVVLGAGEYQLINGEFLHLVDGSWPSNGSLTDEDNFTVTYRFGRVPDQMTKIATLELACELARFYVTGTTKLPPGVTSANIQGASLSLRNAANEVDQYLARVGAFLSVYAPKGVNQTGGVWSPELDHGWTLVRVEGPSQS